MPSIVRRGKMFAYVFGRRKDEVCLKLKALLGPFGLTHYSTDTWGVRTPVILTRNSTPPANATRSKSSASI